MPFTVVPGDTVSQVISSGATVTGSVVSIVNTVVLEIQKDANITDNFEKVATTIRNSSNNVRGIVTPVKVDNSQLTDKLIICGMKNGTSQTATALMVYGDGTGEGIVRVPEKEKSMKDMAGQGDMNSPGNEMFRNVKMFLDHVSKKYYVYFIDGTMQNT